MLLFFALLCGINQAGLSSSPLHSIASDLLAFVIFTPLLFIYRSRGLHRYEMRQMLPTKRELAVLLVPLALIYLVMGLGIRPDVLQNILPQAIVWMMYAGAIVLLYLSLRKSRRVEMPLKDFPARLSKKLYLAFFAVLTLTSAVIGLVPFRMIITVAFLFVGTAVGAAMLVLSVRDILKRR